jgi:hypothetical protein
MQNHLRVTLSAKCRCLGWCAVLLGASAQGQGLSFAQPPIERDSVALVIWPSTEGGNDHFYETVASPKGINWADAESYAESRGGYLATITSERENTFVFKLIDSGQFWLASPSGDSWGPWLGGINSPAARSGGESWQWLHHESAFDYRNWSPLHDDQDNRPDNRLIFFGPGANNRQATWNALPADHLLHGFVVEYDINPLPSSLQYVALFAVSIVGLIALGSVVFFIVRWQRGRATGASSLDG